MHADTQEHTHTLVRIHTIANTYATKPWNTGKIKKIGCTLIHREDDKTKQPTCAAL